MATFSIILICLIIFLKERVLLCLSQEDDDVVRRAEDVRMMLRHHRVNELRRYVVREEKHVCDTCLNAAIYKVLGDCDIALPYFERCDAAACYQLIRFDPEKLLVHHAHCLQQTQNHERAVRILSRVLIQHTEKSEGINDMMIRLIVQRIILSRRVLGKPSDTTEAFFHRARKIFNLPYESSYQLPLDYDITFRDAKPWHDVKSNRVAVMLENNAEEIQNEFRTVMCSIDFEIDFDRDLVMGNKNGWAKYNLMKNGLWDSERCALSFPFLCSLLRNLPEFKDLLEGEVAILKLDRDVNLAPHFGPTNTRLTIHLGLITPLHGVRIRVGNETRRQLALKSIVFDDSFEHEVLWDSESTSSDNDDVSSSSRCNGNTCHHECNTEGSRYVLSLHTHNH